MTTHKPVTPSDQDSHTASVEEMFSGKSVSCPCCGGSFTPSMLQKIMDIILFKDSINNIISSIK
jgi:uncharacterized protein (DUF2225 family)